MTKRIVLLQALASTPADIRRLVRPLDAEASAWKASADDWSPADVVSHLIDVERAYAARLQLVLVEDEPTVPYIHPNAPPREAGTSLSQLNDVFFQAREATLEMLRRLTPGEWQRTAIHETKGRMTLRFLVQDLVDHDIEHTNQLVETIQSWRAAVNKTRSASLSS